MSLQQSSALAGDHWLVGGGEMGSLIRSMDWSATALGPITTWPQSLRTTLSLILNSRYPMFTFWGPDLVKIYNDGYRPILGAKHPWALGRPAREVWPEIWDTIGPMVDRVVQHGESTWSDDLRLFMHRNGYPEEVYFTFSYSPIRDESRGVGGMLCACTETTEKVLGHRRLRLLRGLAEIAGQAKTAEEACQQIAVRLAGLPEDISFALLYLTDDSGTGAALAAVGGIAPGTPVSPLRLDAGDAPWPLEALDGRRVTVDDLPERFGRLPGGAWPESPTTALLLPIPASGRAGPAGLLVAAVSPRLPLDGPYRSFLELVAEHAGSAVAAARAYEQERRRAEALAELDRAKTTFFSNVSHEFRTPLTLMLGPLDDLLRDGAVTPTTRDALTLVQRNGLRLLKLVNNLLDFARIEAGRVQAAHAPTDVASLTAELASGFRAAIERAGLRLVVDCPPLEAEIHVDREMWEKIVLNLLSNAFKFTFDGEIRVAVRPTAAHVELIVEDTGIGIAAGELPHIFERFHRVKDARSRTNEGTGIGLALVQELVRLHGGGVAVTSELGCGTRFVVSVPKGTGHLPAERTDARTLASTAVGVAPYVEEALRWLPDGIEPDGRPAPEVSTPHARVLLADDNADMRSYVGRLLGQHWSVEAVADGTAALAAARARPPDLVLADVMMPGLDGFELLRALREDPATRAVPVILLSARAGEESRVEGLEGGADDYLTKPFSARELIARVNAHLEIARVRRAAEKEVQASAERYRFLADLGDEMTRAADPGTLLATVTRALGEQFRLSRCFFGEVDEQAQVLRVERDYHRGLPSLVGSYPLTAVSAQALADMRAGRIVVNHDVAADPRTAPFHETTYGPLGFGAYVAVPLMREGRWTATLTAAADTPRRWTDMELALLRTAAERAWLAVENRRLFAETTTLLARSQAARAEAEAANRSKDDFLATLSHELRTPLTAIIGWTRLLRVGRLDTDGLHRAFGVIERNALVQVQLIDDLLDISRVVTGKLELDVREVDVATVVAAALETVQPEAATKGVRVTGDIRADVPRVQGDAGRLQQVFWNLLNNAVKFTPPGGRIDVAVETRQDDVVVVVHDDGPGIASEVLPHIFERFRQADASITRAHGGLGLGLALVRHLVERHGGAVWAESDGPGRGATFTVRLPTRGGGAAGGEPTAREPEGDRLPDLGGIRVLLVEDQPDTREMLAAVLGSCGARLSIAASAGDALAELRRQPFDVLVADIGLPGPDGLELLRRLRLGEVGGGRTMPAIALTAYASLDDRQRALAAGFDRHIAKPVDPVTLARAVAALTLRPIA